MRKNLFSSVALSFAALLVAFAFVWNGPASGAASSVTDSEGIYLAGGKAGRPVDDNPTIRRNRGVVKSFEETIPSGEFILSKKRVRVDDAPKPHGPDHNLMEEKGFSTDMLLAKGAKVGKAGKARKGAAPAPRTTPAPFDNPIKNAPHAPGVEHG